MDILCEGAQRFRILEVVEEKPVLLCRVQTFVDDDLDGPSEGAEMAAARAAVAEAAGAAAGGGDGMTELEKAGEEVKKLFLNLMTMASSLKDGESDASQRVEIKNMNPEALSFFLSSLFSTTQQKQALIEVTRSVRPPSARTRARARRRC